MILSEISKINLLVSLFLCEKKERVETSQGLRKQFILALTRQVLKQCCPTGIVPEGWESPCLQKSKSRRKEESRGKKNENDFFN